MQAKQLLTFGPYQFNPHTGQLWRGKQEVKLTGKASALLCYLLERAGQVVTKDELFAAAWSATVVSDAALTSCIQELRHALHDNARKPRFLETMHRRGFRFVGKVVSGQVSVVSPPLAALPRSRPSPGPRPPTPTLVGRAPDLAFLRERLATAVSGERQLVFVTGEPGIGKTTLVEAFLRGSRNWELESGSSLPQALEPKSQSLNPGAWRLGRGQCIEHYGAGEAYLPILEALGRLCREANGERLVPLLGQHAPTWLVQMPALLTTAELETLQRKTAGVTRERMLRELAEALEVITAERPLILVLEDLHWSDVSTLDLLSMLARRQEAARLLIIGTYRPVEVLTRDHPLKGIKQELQLHGQCEELALDFLTEQHVEEYLVVRFPGETASRSPLHALAHHIHQRTDGNPLFMVNVANELVTREVISQRHGQWMIPGTLGDNTIGVAEDLRQLIEQQLTRVSPDERKVLEAASVVGVEFSAAAVAAGTEQTTETVETHCEGLAHREQFLRAQGTSEWPDGTLAARYGFTHALYQEVLYEQLSATRRMRLHRQIGEREEQAYGDRAREIAAEMAVHFERGRDYQRAVQYLQHAGENTLRRSAHQETISLLTKGLELLKTQLDTPERTRQELALLTTLGPALITTRGYAAPEVEQIYTRARELVQQMGETSQKFFVLNGLWNNYEVQGKHKVSYELGGQLLRIAQDRQDPALLILAHHALTVTLFYLEDLSSALMHVEQALTLYDRQKHHSLTFFHGHDPRVSCLLFAGHTLWSLGYPSQALAKNCEAIAWAREVAHPYSLAYALTNTAWRHQLRREAQAAQEHAEVAVALCKEHGFLLMEAQGTIWLGWALAEQGWLEEGIKKIQWGLEAWRATNAELALPYFLTLLAGAYRKIGQIEEGLAVVAEGLAIAHRNNERWYEAELHRLQGELLFESKGHCAESTFGNFQSAAEECFQRAIKIAHPHKAKSLELRATMSLTRLWQQHGKTKQAHKKLAKIYNWFTEGFDTKDLQEAKTLLDSLASRV